MDIFPNVGLPGNSLFHKPQDNVAFKRKKRNAKSTEDADEGFEPSPVARPVKLVLKTVEKPISGEGSSRASSPANGRKRAFADCDQGTMSGCSESFQSAHVPGTSGRQPIAEARREPEVETEGFQSKLVNYFTEVVDKAKKTLGFGPSCLNGGTRALSGNCVCPTYFKGSECQELICINNGTKIERPDRGPVCQCPHSAYITGRHCEIVRCDNNGQPLKNGHCRCLDYWYSGQFCENYTASWGFVIGIPLICIVLIVLCCVVCRLDFCPRRKARNRQRRRPVDMTEPASVRTGRWLRSMEEQIMDQRRAVQQRGCDSALRLQENLLNEENVHHPHGIRADPNIVPSYTIRLDTIPVFNPRMIGGVGEQDIKPLEPPPPYDQAIALSNPPRLISHNASASVQRPPEYTQQPTQPPPPSFRPPDVPL